MATTVTNKINVELTESQIDALLVAIGDSVALLGAQRDRVTGVDDAALLDQQDAIEARRDDLRRAAGVLRHAARTDPNARRWVIGSRWDQIRESVDPTLFTRDDAERQCRHLNSICPEVKAGSSPYFATQNTYFAAR